MGYRDPLWIIVLVAIVVLWKIWEEKGWTGLGPNIFLLVISALVEIQEHNAITV